MALSGTVKRFRLERKWKLAEHMYTWYFCLRKASGPLDELGISQVVIRRSY